MPSTYPATRRAANKAPLLSSCVHCGGVEHTLALVNSSCVSCASKHKAKLKSARERRAKVSVTTVSGSIDYNTRPPSGTNLSIIPTHDVLDTAVTSSETQILEVNPKVPTAAGNPADTAPSKDRTSEMCTAGEIGMKPTSPQARVLPVLYVPGTHRRGGFSATRQTEGNRTTVPQVQGAFKTVQPGLGAHNGLKIWYNGVIQNLGNMQVGTEELRTKIESAFLLDNTYTAEPYALRTLDCSRRLYSTCEVPLPMNKILELVLVKDLNPGVMETHTTGRARGPNGGAPLGRLQSTPDNSTDDHAQRVGDGMSPAAAKAPAPAGTNSRQLFPESDDEMTIRESPDSTPTSYGTDGLHTATRQRAHAVAAPCTTAPTSPTYEHALGAWTPAPGKIHHITCETVNGETEYRYHEIQLQGSGAAEGPNLTMPVHPLQDYTGRPDGPARLHQYPLARNHIVEDMTSVPEGFIDKIVSARRNLMGGPTDRSGIEYLCRLTKSPGRNVPDEGYTWLPGKTLHKFGHVLAEFIRKTEERKEDDTIAQGFAEAAAVPLQELTEGVPAGGAAGSELDVPRQQAAAPAGPQILMAMQPPDRSATRIIANRSSSSTPRLRRQPTIRGTAQPGRARTRRDSAAGTSREHDESPMSLEITGEFPKPQDRRQDAAGTRAPESLSNSPDISEATSLENSRGTSSAHTSRVGVTYGEISERRARARGPENSSEEFPELPLPGKGTPLGEPNPGQNSVLPSENPGKNRSRNISNLPDGLNISNIPDSSNISNVPDNPTSEPGNGSHAQITGTGVNAGTLPAGYNTSTTNNSTQVPAGESVNDPTAVPRTDSTNSARTQRTAAGAPSGQPDKDDSDDGSDGDGPRRPAGHRRTESPAPRRRRRDSSDDEHQRGQAGAGDARGETRRPSRSRSPASEHHSSRSRSRSRSDSNSGSRAGSRSHSASRRSEDRLDTANERLRILANLTIEQYVRCVMQNDEGSAYLDLALRNAQAARDLERNAAPHPPRPQAVRLPRELEWPKVEDKLKYRHSDKRTPIEFRRALEMLTNHVAKPLRTSHLLTKAVELKVNEAILAEFLNPHREGPKYAQAADIDYDEIFDWLTLQYGPTDRKGTCTRAYLDLSQMPHEDMKAYVSRRMLKSAELDRLEIKAILPDLERQLLLSSVEPSLAVWLKTTYPDFESTDPATLAKYMITRDQAVRSAQKGHKQAPGGRSAHPHRNLNAMVSRNKPGQFKRKAAAGYNPAKRSNPKTQNLFAMFDDGDGVSAKSYSQSKHSSGRDSNGTQIPSLRDMKPNYSEAIWNKRVDAQGRLRPNIHASDPKYRALHCKDCWPAGSSTPWCLVCKAPGHNLTTCSKVTKRSNPPRKNGKGKGRGGKQQMKGRSKQW